MQIKQNYLFKVINKNMTKNENMTLWTFAYKTEMVNQLQKWFWCGKKKCKGTIVCGKKG